LSHSPFAVETKTSFDEKVPIFPNRDMDEEEEEDEREGGKNVDLDWEQTSGR